MKWFVWFFAVAYCLALSAAEPVRTWTDLDGRTMKASFVKFAGDKVVILRADGTTFIVKPDVFSAEDRKYLDELRKKAIPQEVSINNVAFPKVIEDYIRKDIKKQDGPLTPVDLAKVTGFDGPVWVPWPAPWLGRLPHLTHLSLYGHEITDVTPLAELTNLKYLDLGDNQITDVTPLMKLTNLKALNLFLGGKISPAQKEMLRKALPKCKINF